MVSIDSLSFKTTPVSFVENLLTSKFYFQYVYPADCETVECTTPEALKGRIQKQTDVPVVTQSSAYMVGRAAFSLGLVPVAMIGTLWNGACAISTLLFWACRNITGGESTQLKELSEKAHHYTKAAFDDLNHSKIPLTLMAERGVTALMPALLKHIQGEWKNSPLLRLAALFGRMAVGAYVAYQVYQVFHHATSPSASLAKLMASDAVSEEHAYLALRLREKLGACTAEGKLLSPELALKNFQEAYKELQSNNRQKMCESLIAPFNQQKYELKTVSTPFTIKKRNADPSLINENEKVENQQASTTSTVEEEIEKLATPFSAQKYQKRNAYATPLSKKISKEERQRLQEFAQHLLVDVKLMIIGLYANGALEGNVPDIVSMWDFQELGKLVEGLTGRSNNQEANAAIALALADLQKFNIQYGSLKIVNDGCILQATQGYRNQILTKITQHEIELSKQVYMKIIPLLTKWNIYVLPYSFPCNGNLVVTSLQNLLQKPQNISAEWQNYIYLLINDLNVIQKKIDLYKVGLDDPSFITTLNQYEEIAAVRGLYARYLQGAEADLIQITTKINHDIYSFIAQGMPNVRVLPYTLPITAEHAITTLQSILNAYGTQFAPDSKIDLERKLAEAYRLQGDVISHRHADRFLLQVASSLQMHEGIDPIVWVRIQQPQPLSFMDFGHKIAEHEWRFLTQVAKTNNEFQYIKEEFKVDIKPIAFSRPIKMDVIESSLNQAISKLKEIQKPLPNENLTVAINDLVLALNELEDNQEYIYIFRDLDKMMFNKDASWKQPDVYMDPVAYETIFYGGALPRKPEEMVKEALDGCKWDQELASKNKTTQLYKDFKNRVLKYREACAKEQTPSLVASYYIGLPDDFNSLDLKKTKRKYEQDVHPDKNGGTLEAKELFSCMNRLFEACEELLKRKGTGSQSAVPLQGSESQSAVRLLTWPDENKAV